MKAFLPMHSLLWRDCQRSEKRGLQSESRRWCPCCCVVSTVFTAAYARAAPCCKLAPPARRRRPELHSSASPTAPVGLCTLRRSRAGALRPGRGSSPSALPAWAACASRAVTVVLPSLCQQIDAGCTGTTQGPSTRRASTRGAHLAIKAGWHRPVQRARCVLSHIAHMAIEL